MTMAQFIRPRTHVVLLITWVPAATPMIYQRTAAIHIKNLLSCIFYMILC